MKDKKLHRVFICIDFPEEAIKEIARVLEILGKWKFDGKMTQLENLHLTLKFLGEIDEEKIEKVKKRLSKIKVEKFEAKFDSIGSFNRRGNPSIVWIRIDGKEIFELQKKIDESLGELFKLEERFMSHITIARVKYVKDKVGFSRHIKGIGVKEIRFWVNGFKLKTSELGEMGPVYTIIEKYYDNE